MACVGLVPKQTGLGEGFPTWNKQRGDTYQRPMVIHCARTAALLTREPGPDYITEKTVSDRRVGVVAMANKLARTV